MRPGYFPYARRDNLFRVSTGPKSADNDPEVPDAVVAGPYGVVRVRRDEEQLTGARLRVLEPHVTLRHDEELADVVAMDGVGLPWPVLDVLDPRHPAGTGGQRL